MMLENGETGGAVPGGEVPCGAVPGGEAPGGEVPGGEVPGGEVPGGEVPEGGHHPRWSVGAQHTTVPQQVTHDLRNLPLSSSCRSLKRRGVRTECLHWTRRVCSVFNMGPKARCTWTLALAFLQGLLGVNLLVVSLVTTLGPFGGPERLPHRDTPYWAAVPLILSSSVGVYYTLTQREKYGGDWRAFVVKCTYFLLSACCAVLCSVAAIFPASHATILLQMDSCRWSSQLPTGGGPGVCLCVRRHTASSHHRDLPHMYEYQVDTCRVVTTHLPALLITLASVATCASLTCLATILLLWRSRYGNFYSGLRFYSYTANDSASSPSSHNMYVLAANYGGGGSGGGDSPTGLPYRETTEALETSPTAVDSGSTNTGSEEEEKLIGRGSVHLPPLPLSSPDDKTDDTDS